MSFLLGASSFQSLGAFCGEKRQTAKLRFSQSAALFLRSIADKLLHLLQGKHARGRVQPSVLCVWPSVRATPLGCSVRIRSRFLSKPFYCTARRGHVKLAKGKSKRKYHHGPHISESLLGAEKSRCVILWKENRIERKN